MKPMLSMASTNYCLKMFWQ